ILTLDYPGEWLSKEMHEARIEVFAECLVLSRALIIMIDPIFYIENDKIQADFYSYGLEKAQNRLRAKQRPKEFVPVKEMPVAVIINKTDLLGKEYLEMNPKEFLMNNCRGFYNSVNRLSKNWEAFFVTCYGIDSKVEKLGEGGCYKPPPLSEIKPLNLNEPFEWIYKQRKKRTLQKFAKAAIFIIFSLCLLYAGLFTWDSLGFRAIEKQETIYSEEPGIICEKYTDYSNFHFASPLTGFEIKVKEKRKYWASEYLNLKLKQPQNIEISDFEGIIAQFKEWCIDIGNEKFSSAMGAKIQKEVKPIFETFYSKVLYKESEQDKYEKGFKKFRELFPYSTHLPLLKEKDIYMNIYTIANNLDGTAGDFKKLVQYCNYYINTSSQHSNKYLSSVEKMLGFIKSVVDTSNGTVKPRTYKIEFLGYNIGESMFGTHKEIRKKVTKVSVKKPKEVQEGWSSRSEYRTAYEEKVEDVIVDVKNTPEVKVIVEAKGKVVFQSLPGRTKEYNSNQAFDFYWIPGEEITIKVQNLTGNIVEIKRSGFLAINILSGELNIKNEAIVQFSGKKIDMPSLMKP
ncbi:MAG: hypothetical protein JSV88_08850, partial [Candidatus Aminicenantes bacterium]